MVSKSERLEKGEVQVRAILEMVGKPKEHIEKTLKDYIKNIKENKDFDVEEDNVEKAIEQEDQKGLFSTFGELQFWTKNVNALIGFCFDYMPSSIEIIEPEKMILNSGTITDMLNDMQARLHHVDMLAKNLHQENQAFNASLNSMVRNNIMISLAQSKLKKEQLTKFAGIKEEDLQGFLDKMLEEKKITEEDGVYSLVRNEDG